jgi:hypothetical protein
MRGSTPIALDQIAGALAIADCDHRGGRVAANAALALAGGR